MRDASWRTSGWKGTARCAPWCWRAWKSTRPACSRPLNEGVAGKAVVPAFKEPPVRRSFFRFWLFAGVLAADQASKLAVRHFLPPGTSYPVLPPWLFLTHVANPGAAFGLLPHRTWLSIGVSVVVLLAAGALPLFWRQAPGKVRTGLAALAAGTLGNLVDRLAAGRVVDFIDLRVWPVFNLADVAVVAGLGLVAWVWLGGEGQCRGRK
ncbi:MAG: signal peptidase II [Firmicutes bacterium]|nr:signal peptidase II [Bacillota bacterium]